MRTAHVGGAKHGSRHVRSRHQLSDAEEQKRLNDVKTAEIRAAQEDPTSMFDMSNARA